MNRKWNGLGTRKIKILNLVSRTPRTRDYVLERLGKGVTDEAALDKLLKDGLCAVVDGLIAATGHGKAIIQSPESYKRWKKQWGKE